MKRRVIITIICVITIIFAIIFVNLPKKGKQMTFMELAQKRYSVRKYMPIPVEQEKIEEILKAGNIAPTAKNIQPQRIYVLKSKEALEKLAKLTPMGFDAPVVLLIAYNQDEEWQNPLQEGIHSGVEDVSIVATHIMLRAAELGIGSCWVNYFPNNETEKAFNLPNNEKVVLLMPIGYPAEDSKPNPNHTKKKPLNETVKYL